jgi:hypothetical protein
MISSKHISRDIMLIGIGQAGEKTMGNFGTQE